MSKNGNAAVFPVLIGAKKESAEFGHVEASMLGICIHQVLVLSLGMEDIWNMTELNDRHGP